MKKLCILIALSSFALNATAAVKVCRVIPNKIIYRVAEDGHAKVTLENDGDTAESGTLRLTDQWNAMESRVITSQDFKLAPKETKTIEIPYNSGTERYGHELRAEALQDGKTVDAKSEFFNVINEWWRVSVGATNSPNTKLREELYAYYHIPLAPYRQTWYPSMEWVQEGHDCGPFLHYGNNRTWWAMAHSAVGKLVDASIPLDKVWHSGPLSRRNSDLLDDRRNCARFGYKLCFYTINNMDWACGLELARQNPEKALRDRRGGFEGRFLSVPADPLQLSKLDKPSDVWCYVNPNFHQPETVEWALEKLIEGVRFSGVDGVYFDYPYFAQEGYDHTGAFLGGKSGGEATIRNLALARQRLRQAKPDIYIWTNGINEESPQSEALNDPGSGGLLEIQDSFITNPNMSYNTWRGLMEAYLNARNQLWTPKKGSRINTRILHTGYVYPLSGKESLEATREQWAFSNHVAALMAAAAAHPYVNGIAFRPLMQLMTRYSEFFWHEDIELLKDAYKKFNVDGLREVWWEDTVYARKTPAHTDYYVHLVNVPDQEKATHGIRKDPGAADDIEVSTTLPLKLDKVEAWAIQPYGYGAKTLEPVVRAVKPEALKGETIFSIPAFKYYTLLIIREHK